MPTSQIETSAEICDLVSMIKTPVTSESLITLRNLMYSKLEIRPYNDSTSANENKIRWTRTAAEILKDGAFSR